MVTLVMTIIVYTTTKIAVSLISKKEKNKNITK